MPKTTKTSRPSSSQQSPKGFAALRHWYGKRSTTQLLIVALALLVAGFFGFKQAQIYQERSTYRSAEKQITAFVDEAAKLAPSTKKMKNKYCTRISEKFEDGALTCVVEEKLVFQSISPDSFLSIEAEMQKREAISNWTKEFTERPRENSSGTIRKTIYKYNDLTCGIFYRYINKDESVESRASNEPGYSIEASCSGPALKEYY